MTDWIDAAERIDVTAHSTDGQVAVRLRTVGPVAVELDEEVLDDHADHSLAVSVTEAVRAAQWRFRAAWDEIRGADQPFPDFAVGVVGEGASSGGCAEAWWREDGDGSAVEFRSGTLLRFDLTPQRLAAETAEALTAARDAYIEHFAVLLRGEL